MIKLYLFWRNWSYRFDDECMFLKRIFVICSDIRFSEIMILLCGNCIKSLWFDDEKNCDSEIN